MTSDAHSPGKTAPAASTQFSRSPIAPSAQMGSSKSETITKLMSRAKGATSAELVTGTGWKAHSIRAFLSGLRKSGRTVVREARKDGELSYRLNRADTAEPAKPEIPTAAIDVVEA